MPKLGVTSYKQTKFGILPRDEVIKLEVQGTKKGLQTLQKIAESNRSISLEFIKGIHKKCFGSILQKDAGNFRLVQVTYSSKEAPHYSKVPETMKNLCDDTEYALIQLPNNEDENYISKLVEILARFQHSFVFVHPFVDYNGRMARLFTNYILMRAGLPIIEIMIDNETDRKAYITALQKADDSDYTEIENIIAESLVESLQQVSNELESLQETAQVMAIPNIKRDISKSRTQIKKGQYIKLEDLK